MRMSLGAVPGAATVLGGVLMPIHRARSPNRSASGMSTRRLRGGLVLALAAGTLFPAAGASARAISPPTPAAQRFGVRLAGVPVAEEHNPRAYRYIIDYLPAAAVIHRRIMVLNEESHAAHFTVYPDAAQISHGSFVGDDGATRSELTTWISVQHPELTLGPHTSAMDMITIRVSREPTRGEHYGVIWVQQETRGHAANGVALNEVARVGVRIYLAVGPGGVPPTNFTISAITGHHTRQGALVITAPLRNTGGRAVDLDGTARLTRGPGGTSAGPYPVHQVVTIAPGQSYPVTFIPGRRLPFRGALARQHQPGQRVHQAHRLRDHPLFPGHGHGRALGRVDRAGLDRRPARHHAGRGQFPGPAHQAGQDRSQETECVIVAE